MKRQTTAKEGMVPRDPWANAILGWTFKEDVPDIRNTRVIDIYQELRSYGVDVLPYDPNADAKEVAHEYGVSMLDDPASAAPYDAVIVAVPHRAFKERFDANWLLRLGGARPALLLDLKGALGSDAGAVWRL